MRVLAALTALIVLQAGTAPAVQSPGDSPSAAGPTRTPQSVTVRIDVIAADAKGRVLDNLRPSDFALVDDGAVQTLEGVKFVRAASDDPRIVALFLDEYHVSAESTESVRTSLTRFVEQDLRAQDLLVVMKPLDSIFTIAPTTDRGPALEAIRAFEGRAGDFEARNAYERNFMAGTPARIEQARTQVALSAINAIAVHLASYADQRKTIVVVSEGFGRGERRRGLEFLPTVETIVRSAQQANASIYAVSPRAEAPEGDVLPGLSTETMGHATVADLDGGLRRALTDASGYYLLTYRTQRPDDGRFHAVQVTVKKPGTEVRARKGYYAPSPDAALRAAVLARINNPTPAPPPEPAPHASPLIRPWLGTTRGADGKTRVTFVWEPVVRLTGERNRQTPTRLVLTALDVHDAVLYEGVVLPTAPGLIEEPGAASRVVFDMPPGRLRLRMSIQDAAQRSLDTDVRSITIREMDKGVAIGTPEVLRARNAREFRALASEAAVPAASREFSRTERLLIRFNAYSSDDAALTVTARLLSRMGPMRDLPITRASDRREIDLPLAGLATGEYTVELTATGTTGEARDVVTFRVTT
jgi:VWFA-related protein